MSTPTTDLPGIGPATAAILAENGFKSAADIAATDVKTLSVVPGFGPVKSKAAIAAAKTVAGKPKSPKAKSKSKSKKKKDAPKAKAKAKAEKKKSDKKSKKKKSDKKAKSKDKSKKSKKK